jgi:hypothetical protein
VINKAKVEKRLAELKAAREECKAQYNALNGAVCELEALLLPEPQTPSEPEPTTPPATQP